MSSQKTKRNDNNVFAFLERIDHPQRKSDAFNLLTIFSEKTGFEGKMWGESIVGFGSYHYIYPSGHEGDAPLVGFSPRKSRISLYFATGDETRGSLLDKLGKHRSGKACVYINKLEDIDVAILKELIEQSVTFLKNKYPNNSSFQ